jgi:twitching motility protein PilJ
MTSTSDRPAVSPSKPAGTNLAGIQVPQPPHRLQPLQPQINNLDQPRRSLIQKFNDLPISRKQLIALLSSEVFSLLLIVVGSRFVIESGLRTQLLNQAQSEVAVTDVNYNIKINQMGYGSRGQADNPAIIAAAKAYSNNQGLAASTEAQVRSILKNEVQRRNMEYATLVDKDLKIVANANANRRGEIFNPNNLVEAVFADPRQIKASAIVGWDEIKTENPPLPKGFAQQDALIRYTITAIKDPSSKKVVGALVFGDIVNNKKPIVKGTLKAFDGGYSAIYQRDANDKFVLSTALNQATGQTLQQAKANLPLPNTKLLAAAVAAQGKPVTGRLTIAGQTYTVAAKAIPNLSREESSGPVPIINDNSVAILVRGTPETALNTLLNQALLQELSVLLAALAVIAAWTVILQRTIVRPVEKLQATTQRFAEGDEQARAEIFANDEVGQLAVTFNQMAEARVGDKQRNQLLKDITLSISQSFSQNQVLEIAVSEIRQALKCDRVVIYEFDPDWVGTVSHESVKAGWPAALTAVIEDPCFRTNWVNAYTLGRVQATSNIYQAGLTKCHIQQLEQLEVKANLVAPILLDGKLIGLLIAHQCSAPRDWQSYEVDLFAQLALQVGNALARVALIEQQQVGKELLENHALELLLQVAPLRRGDLTIRAEVTDDEIGTIADSYNATIGSLHKLVTQVQQAAGQVTLTADNSEEAVQDLSQDALQQAELIKAVVSQISEISQSIKTIAQSAEAAEAAVQVANQTVNQGDRAMNLTVEGFLAIRDTVTDTGKKVKQLGESSQKISKVVKLIGDFAAQTNLLALKASIEAARAGDEGRGFVVLADEVRSLAQQSAKATEEIDQLVTSIQVETNQVVAAMETGSQQVLTGTRLVEESRQSLTQIAVASDQIAALVQAIAAAAIAQSQASKAVTANITDVAAITDTTPERANQVLLSFQDLLNVAQELQTTVSQFKLS